MVLKVTILSSFLPLQGRLRSLPPPRPDLDDDAPLSLTWDKPEFIETPSHCSPFGTWTVGNCNEQHKRFPGDQNYYSCLADGSYSPYQGCDASGESCTDCVYMDTGILRDVILFEAFRVCIYC